MFKRSVSPTILVTGVFCLLFLGFAFSVPLLFKQILSDWTSNTLSIFGDYYLYLGFGIVVVMLAIAFSPKGKIKLGKVKPEFTWFSWIAMLYSTGMGAGLMLRAVQEPVYYLIHPPNEVEYSDRVYALQYSYFHWGFTPWAFYGMFGLIISYNLYLNNRTILSSAILEPHFQKKRFITPIDTITIISTLLGVVAAVGLGSRQLLDGFSYLFNTTGLDPVNTLYIVVLVSGLATFSAYQGVTRGIRILSNFNISLAIFLLLFVCFQGNVSTISTAYIVSFWQYLKEFIPMSLNIGDHQVSKTFLTDWTYFYWAFWLAWAPFTGVFIARISKGRTIRQFILATLIIPSVGTFFWFSAFGTNAFELIGDASTYQGQFDSIYSAIFVFFNYFPLSEITNTVAYILIFTFLITSIDSAIFVLGMFSDGGKEEPRKKFRLVWGITLTLFTIAVVLVGKEELLASVSQMLILFALPFSFLFLGMIVYFLFKLNSKVFKNEYR